MTPLELSLFGAPADHPNLGLAALSEGFLSAVLTREPDARCTVFDSGWGARPAVHGASQHTYTRMGARYSRRWDRPESFDRIALGLKMRGRGNRAAATLRRSAAVLDVSGGDSFGDLYGLKRFATVAEPKRLALEHRLPLVLLPQTYGPFRDPGVRAEAERLVRGAAAAWARDGRSFAVLQDLLGSAFDPSRHKQGVDMAFAMQATQPRFDESLAEWLQIRSDGPVVGLNVSGLVYNDPAARETYGLSVDYPEVVRRLLTYLVEAGVRVVLVPHVLDPHGVESDPRAAAAVRDLLSPSQQERVRLAPPLPAPAAKWLIGQCDWFCGTRMHSTVAGLSSGVATDAIAYSLKFEGVFATCAQQDRVHEARSLSTDEMFSRLVAGFERRDRTRQELSAALPGLLRELERQSDDVVATCRQEQAARARR